MHFFLYVEYQFHNLLVFRIMIPGLLQGTLDIVAPVPDGVRQCGSFYLLNMFMRAETLLILGAHCFCDQAHVLWMPCFIGRRMASKWVGLCKADT